MRGFRTPAAPETLHQVGAIGAVIRRLGDAHADAHVRLVAEDFVRAVQVVENPIEQAFDVVLDVFRQQQDRELVATEPGHGLGPVEHA